VLPLSLAASECVEQGLSEYGFLAESGPEYGYNPEYVAEYSSMIVH